MSLLSTHLGQISSSARTIGDLPFVLIESLQKPNSSSFSFLPPKIFTNAILGNHEITSLIRDTEPHERALFSVDPNARVLPTQRRPNRRTTTFASDESKAPASFNAIPRKQTAVSRFLGPDMLHEIENYRGNTKGTKWTSTEGVDVEVLLRGAEKLCAVYPVAGAPEKIMSLRHRHKQVADSLALYEAKVASQAAQLNRVNKTSDGDEDYEEGDRAPGTGLDARREAAPVSDAELRAEEREIAELEQRKRALEERVISMEKDLGGLLR